jgi:hypothetical protein
MRRRSLTVIQHSLFMKEIKLHNHTLKKIDTLEYIK